MTMKVLYSLLLLLGLSIIVGCQNSQENTMVLLDEKVKEVKVSKSSGIGDMNQDIIFSFNDEKSIKVFEKAIRTAVKKQSNINETKPDYDVMVGYGERFPTHAIHIWLGEKDEKSTLMYMVGEGEAYITSSKTTNQLRELILSEQ
jgi:Tfp pilus assembly protein PilP